MENMDLINQPIEIKQEVEKHDEMDEIDNTAYMNSEKVYPYYGAQCDGIKIEEDTQNKQNESDSDTLKREFIWMQANEQVFEAEIEKMKNENSIHHDVDPAQLAEESDTKVESGIIATSDSVQHRIKTEPTGNYGGEDNSTTDAVDQVKIEGQPVVEVKSEKLEELYMDSIKSEDMDASQLNAELDIKCERDMSIMAGSSLDSAAKKKKCGKGLQVDGIEAERELFICYNCNYTAYTKTRLIQHIGVGKCNLKANSAKSQLAYTRQHPLNDYVCTQCNIVFRRKLNLDEHIIKKHIESIGSVSSKIHECTHCDYKTTRKNILNRHMLIHPSVVYKFSVCKHCNASFKSEQSLDNHVIKKHPDFKASIGKKIHECSSCSYKTTVLKYFNRHMKIHSNDKGSTCKHCDATFKCKVSLDDHIVRKHPHFSASVSYKIHQCTNCDYKSARKHDLDKHMLKHLDPASSDNLITCKHCDGKYKSEQGLNNHIIKEHPDFIASVTRKIHECLYCPFKTAYKHSFDGHMTSHSDRDSNGKLNPCKHCTATFTCKYYLDDHIVKKHPDFIASVKRKIHECTYCTYKTVRKDTLEKHILSHHRNTVQLVSSTK